MSALDAIQTDDGHTKNYGQGITALAEYIDEQLQTDHAALSGLIGRFEEKVQARLQEHEGRLDDAEHEIVARPLQEQFDTLQRRVGQVEKQAKTNKSRLDNAHSIREGEGGRLDQAFADLEALAVTLEELESKTSARNEARKTTDSQLRRQLDAQAEVLARLCGFYEEHDTVDEAITYMLDHPEEATKNTPNVVGIANVIQNLAEQMEGLYDQLDACVQGLTEHEEKIGKREREIEGLDTRIGRIEDRLEGLEDAVYADEAKSTAQEALSVARRAEQKADDTDALLGELLGEGVLRAESVTTGTFTDGTASEQAAKEGRWDDVELGLNHVAALVQKAFDDPTLEAVLSGEGRAPGLAFSLEDEPVQYVALPTLEVKMWEQARAYDLTTALRDTYLGELREDEAKAPDGETPDEEDTTEEASSTGDLSPGQQTGALKSAINRAFEDGELHDCVGYPDFGHVRFSLRSHRYRVMYLEGGGLFVEEVDDGMFKRNERAALVEDALELALS